MTYMTQFLALSFPDIDPILLQIGPFAIRWYALAYIAGLVIGWRILIRFAKMPGSMVSPQQADDFLVWATLGIIFGGRLGYVVFYKPAFYLSNPQEIFMVWQGGMSFHGGFLGVVLAAYLFAKKRGVPPLALADMLATVAPIGLFFGRVANFINGELYGRMTDVSWAFIFPNGGPLPRHPSQLYEAALEGALLFIVIYGLRMSKHSQKQGLLTGVFLVGYALARGFVELFRQPDAHLGFLVGGLTMGQLLSIPMILIGLYLILRPKAKRA